MYLIDEYDEARFKLKYSRFLLENIEHYPTVRLIVDQYLKSVDIPMKYLERGIADYWYDCLLKVNILKNEIERTYF